MSAIIQCRFLLRHRVIAYDEHLADIVSVIVVFYSEGLLFQRSTNPNLALTLLT